MTDQKPRSRRSVPSRSSPPPSGSRTVAGFCLPLAALVLAFVIVLFIYGDSLSGAYVFDDLQAFGGDLNHVPFPTPDQWLHPATRPVIQAWFWLLTHLPVPPVLAYRVSGVLIHLFNAMLLFLLVRNTSRYLLDLSEQCTRLDHATCMGIGAAGLWMVHPVCVQAVCSIVQQSETVMATYLLVYLLVIFRRQMSPRWWQIPAIYGVMAGGLCSKIVMVSAIPVGVLFAATLSRKSIRQTVIDDWNVYIVPCLVGGLMLSSFIPGLLEGRAGVGFGGDSPPTVVYGLSSLRSFVVYGGLFAWPHPLSVDRSPLFVTRFSDAIPYLILAVAYAAFAITRWVSAKWLGAPGRLWGWLLLSPIILLAPTTSVVPTADPVFEHRVYLPFAFLCWFVVFVMRAVVDRIDSMRKAYLKVGLYSSVAAVFLLFALVARLQAANYQSPIRLWIAALSTDPDNARAAQNLVAAMQSSNLQDQLLDRLSLIARVAERRRVKADATLHQIAKELLRRQQPHPAASILAELTQRVPPAPRMLTDRQRREGGERWFDYAIALFQIDDLHQATHAVNMSLLLTPKDPFAHAFAGDIFMARGDREKAIEQWMCAVKYRVEPWPEMIQRINAAQSGPQASSVIKPIDKGDADH